MRPHALMRGMQAVGEKWHVESCFSMGFPSTCRSASCASEFEVFGRRRAGRKKSLTTAATARRFDGSVNDEGFRKENKIDRKETRSHKKIRFSLLTLIPCEERKGRIPNFYYIHEKLTTTLHIGLIYIYIYIHTCSWVP